MGGRPASSDYWVQYYQKNKERIRKRNLTKRAAVRAELGPQKKSSKQLSDKKKYAATPHGAAALRRGWKMRKLRKRSANTGLSNDEKRQVAFLIACAVELGPTCHLEHIIPLCRGGTNHPANLTIVSASVNKMKGSRTLDELCQTERVLYDSDVLKFDPRLC